jgi:hypothetical protein
MKELMGEDAPSGSAAPHGSAAPPGSAAPGEADDDAMLKELEKELMK